jgi:hypothetical protein
MMSFLAYLQSPPIVESVWPVSVVGWVSFVAVLGGVLIWVARYGKDRAGWDKAAAALERLSNDVASLLFEIRGVNGKGGLSDRILEIEVDLERINKRNTEADVLVEIYKRELRQRAAEGEPNRRTMDRVIGDNT